MQFCYKFIGGLYHKETRALKRDLINIKVHKFVT